MLIILTSYRIMMRTNIGQIFKLIQNSIKSDKKYFKLTTITPNYSI